MIRMLVAATLSLAFLSSADASVKKPARKPLACAIIMGAGGGGSGWRIAKGPCIRKIDMAPRLGIAAL